MNPCQKEWISLPRTLEDVRVSAHEALGPIRLEVHYETFVA
jgi:hypothetical protein